MGKLVCYGCKGRPHAGGVMYVTDGGALSFCGAELRAFPCSCGETCRRRQVHWPREESCAEACCKVTLCCYDYLLSQGCLCCCCCFCQIPQEVHWSCWRCRCLWILATSRYRTVDRIIEAGQNNELAGWGSRVQEAFGACGETRGRPSAYSPAEVHEDGNSLAMMPPPPL